MMRAPVRVVSPADVRRWVREQQQGRRRRRGRTARRSSRQGCGSCHAFEPAGTTAEVGPYLDNLQADAQRAGKPLEEYVRESIVDPDAYVVPGLQQRRDAGVRRRSPTSSSTRSCSI